MFYFRIIGTLSKDHSKMLEVLEEIKKAILLKEEEFWRCKSKALWIHQGDYNSIFFQKYANHRRNINTIWKAIQKMVLWSIQSRTSSMRP